MVPRVPIVSVLPFRQADDEPVERVADLELAGEARIRLRERTGFGILVALLQFGVLSDALTKRNMDTFAAEVMPHLRD